MEGRLVPYSPVRPEVTACRAPCRLSVEPRRHNSTESPWCQGEMFLLKRQMNRDRASWFFVQVIHVKRGYIGTYQHHTYQSPQPTGKPGSYGPHAPGCKICRSVSITQLFECCGCGVARDTCTYGPRMWLDTSQHITRGCLFGLHFWLSET